MLTLHSCEYYNENDTLPIEAKIIKKIIIGRVENSKRNVLGTK